MKSPIPTDPHEAIDLTCPVCGCPMKAKILPFNIAYDCPDCGEELWQDRRTGRLREPQYNGWAGD